MRIIKQYKRKILINLYIKHLKQLANFYQIIYT